MKKSKVLININSWEELEEYKKIGFCNFLFAVSYFSIGYPSFPLKSIPDGNYLFINRILDTEGIERLKACLPTLKKSKGILFEDVGVFHALKDTGIPLIWFQNHFGTNYDSMNFWLRHGCESAVISNELTDGEILEIIEKTCKPLILNVFGKNQVMYSRRHLLSNYQKHSGYPSMKDATIKNKENQFLVKEADEGTVLFSDEYFNLISFAKRIEEKKIFFYLVMNLDKKTREIEAILNGKECGNDGFLHKKTVYKMQEYNDR